MGGKTPWADLPKFFSEERIRDVITCFKFGDDRLSGLASAEGQISPFPIDFHGRPYNTHTTVWACDIGQVIADFVPNFVAMATGVIRG